MEKIIEEVEKILKPEYMNDVYTWAQIKNAIASISPAKQVDKTYSEEDLRKAFWAIHSYGIKTFDDFKSSLNDLSSPPPSGKTDTNQ